MSLQRRKPLARVGRKKQAEIDAGGSRDPLRRTPIRRVSRKRAAEHRLRADVRKEVIGRDGGCVGRPDGHLDLPGPCDGGELHVHELIRRAQWAKGHLVPANCVALCPAHHRWAHDNPEAARAAGALRSGHEPRPAADS